MLGVDIIDVHLELARSRYASVGPRLRFEHQSVYALDAADGSFDLTVCRHVLQSIPHADQVLAELARVTRAGGYLHVIAEDYGMLHFQRGALDPREFWHTAVASFAAATGTDLFIGRNVFGILAAMGLEQIAIDYIVVDTLRVPRETFAAIFEAWRDGYADAIGELTPITRESAAGILQPDDCQRPRSAGLRGVDGSGRQRPRAQIIGVKTTVCRGIVAKRSTPVRVATIESRPLNHSNHAAAFGCLSRHTSVGKRKSR